MAVQGQDGQEGVRTQPAPSTPIRALLLFTAGTVAVVAIMVILLAWNSPLTRQHNPQTQNAYVDGDATALSAQVQGYVRQLPIADNQVVRAGDLIAQLDDANFRVNLEQAKAQADVAAAALRSFDAQEQAALLQVSQAAASLDAARATVGSATPDSVRQAGLAPTDAGLGRNLDAAKSTAQVAGAGVDRAQAQLEAAQRQLAVLAARKGQAQATLAARKADTALAAITLGRTRIVAPVNGTVGVRAVRIGSLLMPGTEIVEITPLDTVWVTANFTERQIANIRPGSRARIQVDAFPDAVLDGHVAALSPATAATFSNMPADNTTGNYTKVVQRLPVKIAIDWNGSPLRGQIRPGMSVVASVATDGASPSAPTRTR